MKVADLRCIVNESRDSDEVFVEIKLPSGEIYRGAVLAVRSDYLVVPFDGASPHQVRLDRQGVLTILAIVR